VLNCQDHGLYAPHGDGPVTLKCNPNQEASAYADVQGHFDSFEQLKLVCPFIPVHFIFGERIELMYALGYVISYGITTDWSK
jgi:hypothetical protein